LGDVVPHHQPPDPLAEQLTIVLALLVEVATDDVGITHAVPPSPD